MKKLIALVCVFALLGGVVVAQQLQLLPELRLGEIVTSLKEVAIGKADTTDGSENPTMAPTDAPTQTPIPEATAEQLVYLPDVEATEVPTQAPTEKAPAFELVNGEYYMFAASDADAVEMVRGMDENDLLSKSFHAEGYALRVLDGHRYVVTTDGQPASIHVLAGGVETDLLVHQENGRFLVEDKEQRVTEINDLNVGSLRQEDLYEKAFCQEHYSVRSAYAVALKYPYADTTAWLTQVEGYVPFLCRSVFLVEVSPNTYQIRWRICDEQVTAGGGGAGNGGTKPSQPTQAPATTPTASPTVAPTASPTVAPTASPTVAPTASPTVAPTASPTVAPTASPTVAPTASPTQAPATTPAGQPDYSDFPSEGKPDYWEFPSSDDVYGSTELPSDEKDPFNGSTSGGAPDYTPVDPGKQEDQAAKPLDPGERDAIDRDDGASQLSSGERDPLDRNDSKTAETVVSAGDSGGGGNSSSSSADFADIPIL